MYLSLSGLITSLRFYFAFFGLDERKWGYDKLPSSGGVSAVPFTAASFLPAIKGRVREAAPRGLSLDRPFDCGRPARQIVGGCRGLCPLGDLQGGIFQVLDTLYVVALED